jgi:predicted CXXCH cytochrome family protein
MMKAGRTLMAFCVAAAILCGCETTTRYKVLSFFFDGVPNPELEKTSKGPDRTGVGAAAPQGSMHGPYLAKQCGACHERGTNALVAPIGELCFRCHVIKMDKKWVHGPLASGGCRFCHVPHTSSNPFLLVSALANSCFSCHDEEAIKKGEHHKGTEMKCTYCHDAHMSDKKYMLK